MSLHKILTVFGATGNQGGSVINSVLAHPKLSQEFSIRAITRDVTKPSSLALQEKGVEVVAADMNDKSSLVKALAGSHTVFGMTNFYETLSKEKEVSQGKNLADAAKEAQVSHLIFSSLPNVTKLTNGQLAHVSHFDSKAEVEDYARSLGIPTTPFWPAVFSDMFAGMIRKNPATGSYQLALPFPSTTPIPMLDPVYDTGKFVAAILLAGPSEKPVLGCSGWYTPEAMVDTFKSVTGKEATFMEAEPQVFKGFLPPPIATELLENMFLIKDWKYYGLDAEERVKESLALLGGEKLATLAETFGRVKYE